MIENSIKLI